MNTSMPGLRDSLTIESLWDLYRKLPPAAPRMSLLVPLQARVNEQISMQMEVIRSAWLPAPIVKCPRRVDYKTRAGYRMARDYWRSQMRKVKRGEVYVAYLIGQQTKQAEESFFWRNQRV